jgi:hypothetical protein
VFVADCGPVISVRDGVADGYARVTKKVARGMMDSTAISSNATAECVMVESNGTEYRTTRWMTRVRVIQGWGFHAYAVFELYCYDG